jgi:hypothetical protein
MASADDGVLRSAPVTRRAVSRQRPRPEDPWDEYESSEGMISLPVSIWAITDVQPDTPILGGPRSAAANQTGPRGN